MTTAVEQQAQHTISAEGRSYRDLNEEIRSLVSEGATEIVVNDVLGHRYIGTGITAPDLTIHIHGVPGEDLAAFTDGPRIIVYNNAQDGVGNTMNDGRIEVHGKAGDVIGYGMRGGRIYVKSDVGYRVGIHMKGYREKQPMIVIGGCAGNFFGEYMAGGCQILLGLGNTPSKPTVGSYCATGMHGGIMYVRDRVEKWKLGAEVNTFPLDDFDRESLDPILADFAQTFDIQESLDNFEDYTKILPVSTRPYGQLYVY